MSSNGKQNIIIVGGGGAGKTIARELSQKLPVVSSKYNIILITARECYVHMPAALRMLVTKEGELEKNALIPYDSLFVNNFGSIKVGTVTDVVRNSVGPGGDVLLDGGEKVAYRYLVVATGSVWEGPLASLEGRKAGLLSAVGTWRQSFQNSKSIVLAGGGSVGLELAGELRDTYPDKEITIVHAASLPLNDAYPEKFRKDVARRWKKRGIKFIFDDRIEVQPEGSFSSVATAKGVKVNADSVVLSRGGRPNTALLRSLGSDVLDAQGYVKVSQTLQLTNYPDIFAAGDIMAWKEQKALAKIPGHVAVIVANILSLATGEEPKKYYQGTFEAIFITDGKAHGAGYLDKLWGLMFGDTVVPMAKGKTLFIPQARTSLGLTASA